MGWGNPLKSVSNAFNDIAGGGGSVFKKITSGGKKTLSTLADAPGSMGSAFQSGMQRLAGSTLNRRLLEGASVPVRGLASVGNLVRGQNPAEPWQTGDAMYSPDTWKSALLGGGLVAGGVAAYPYLTGAAPIEAGAISGPGAITGAEAAGAGAAASPFVGAGSLGGAGAAGVGAGTIAGGAAPLAAGGIGAAATNPWVVGGLLAGKGALSYLQGREQKQATDPYAEYSERAMDRMDQYAQNPNLMYQNDEGLRQIRQNALNAVTSRQLATTGGLEGGNYARQLMQESAAVDRENLMALANLNATIAGRAQPFAQANIEMGNPGYTAMSSVINDADFMNLLGQLKII